MSTYPDVVRQAQVDSQSHTLFTHPIARTRLTLRPLTPPHTVRLCPPAPQLIDCTVPCRCAVLQTEAVETWNTKLSKPGTWTWGDVLAGGIIGIQVVGAFALGEVIGRGSLIGYAVGDSHGH